MCVCVLEVVVNDGLGSKLLALISRREKEIANSEHSVKGRGHESNVSKYIIVLYLCAHCLCVCHLALLLSPPNATSVSAAALKNCRTKKAASKFATSTGFEVSCSGLCIIPAKYSV